MLLERTISQLDVGYVPEDRAIELGQLGYLQWLGALPDHASYVDAAMGAYETARPFIPSSPAVGVFCQLLADSAMSPARPVTLKLLPQTRRGGAKARRTAFRP